MNIYPYTITTCPRLSKDEDSESTSQKRRKDVEKTWGKGAGENVTAWYLGGINDVLPVLNTEHKIRQILRKPEPSHPS